MESEIRSQVLTLPRLKVQRREENCLFVGSGDSYAACLSVQYATSGRASCCHPLDFLRNPSVGLGRTVYVVSVSGKTNANVRAARAAREAGLGTVAITANPDSPLAASCDRVIPLEYHSAGVTTAGTASFVASLVTCLCIAFEANVPKNIPGLLSSAQRQAGKIVRSIPTNASSFLVLGNGVFYPVAMYLGMKLNEIVGARADAYPTEAFCHSPLFGLKKSDVVIALGNQDDVGQRLSSRLTSIGINSSFVEIPDARIVEVLLRSVFFVQALALKIAQRRGVVECYFLRNKKLLGISSDLIY